MDYNFRIFDFNIFNEKKSNESSYDEDGNIIESDEEEVKSYKDNAKFMIQMFGVDETGKTCSIMVRSKSRNGDLKEFSMAIDRLFRDRIFSEMLGKGANDKFNRELSWEAKGKQLYNILNQINQKTC